MTEEGGGLSSELEDRIHGFNVEATGIDDGRLLHIAIRDDGELIGGLAGWTWGGCGYIDLLWVREDQRGRGLGTTMLDAAEAEAAARGCTKMVLSSHSFQAPDLYRRRGYVEYGRVEDYPRGHAQIHLEKLLVVPTSIDR